MEHIKKNSVGKEKAKIKKSPLDKFENQKFADQIPLEDLKIEAEQEKNKKATQQSSQSEKNISRINNIVILRNTYFYLTP